MSIHRELRSDHNPDCDEQGPCVRDCRYIDPDDASDLAFDAAVGA
ncbi:MAG: hypothetical protein JWM93_2441 [Frankiales bacterium]|nr:hypothetical protein [Frankiales bacterium]